MPVKRTSKHLSEKQINELVNKEILYFERHSTSELYSIKGSSLNEKIKLFRERRDSQMGIFPDYDNISNIDLRAWWLACIDKQVARCSICGQLIKGKRTHNLDHFYPKHFGGLADGKNGVLSHKCCNTLKSDILPNQWEEIGLIILFKNNIKVDLSQCLYDYKKVNIK